MVRLGVVVGLFLVCAGVAHGQSSDPYRTHQLGEGWHPCTGLWSIDDGPGREAGLISVSGYAVESNQWTKHGYAQTNDRWQHAVDFVSAYGGQERQPNTGDIYTGTNGTGSWPPVTYAPCVGHQQTSSQGPFTLPVKNWLDSMRALAGSYKFRVFPGYPPTASSAPGWGEFAFKYSPLNGDCTIHVKDTAGAPVVGVRVLYNSAWPDGSPTQIWVQKTGLTDAQGNFIIRRATSVERSVRVNVGIGGGAPGYFGQYGTAQGEVVGYEGGKSSHYNVVLSGGQGTITRGADDSVETPSSCLEGQHWNGTGCVSDAGGAQTCATGYHWDAAASGCVADAAAPPATGGTGSGSTSGPPDPAFWTREFWINILKDAFVPASSSLDRFKTKWETLAGWGPFGVAKSLSVDYKTGADAGKAANTISAEPVWAVPNFFARWKPTRYDENGQQLPAEENEPFLVDLRPELNLNGQPAGYAGYGRLAGRGSWVGGFVFNMRIILGYLVWVFSGLMLVKWVKPRITI